MCGLKFTHRNHYNYHIKRECGRKFPCPHCLFESTSKTNLKKHVINIHKEKVQLPPNHLFFEIVKSKKPIRNNDFKYGIYWSYFFPQNFLSVFVKFLEYLIRNYCWWDPNRLIKPFLFRFYPTSVKIEFKSGILFIKHVIKFYCITLRIFLWYYHPTNWRN